MFLCLDESFFMVFCCRWRRERTGGAQQQRHNRSVETHCFLSPFLKRFSSSSSSSLFCFVLFFAFVLTVCVCFAVAVAAASRGDAQIWDETRGYCLGLVLDLLRGDGTTNSPSRLDAHHHHNHQHFSSSSVAASDCDAELLQLCYRLVYTLCATPHTGARVLAYVRHAQHAFLLTHLQRLGARPLSADPIVSRAPFEWC